MRFRVGALAVLLLIQAAVPAADQASKPQPPTGVIAGALVSADGAVRNAQVRLVSTSPRLTRTTTTDGEGQFRFTEVPGGEYTLSAAKPGYLDMVYGARRPGAGRPGTPVVLSAGQRIEKLALSLTRGGVIAGTVTDEFGDAAFNTTVRALRFVFADGARTVQAAGTAMTDDLGAYRLAGLLPGEYLVTVVPRDTVAAATAQQESLAARQAQILKAARTADNAEGQAALLRVEDTSGEAGRRSPPGAVGYVPIYYPDATTAATALVVRLDVSQQVFGIDMRLQRIQTVTIAGVVTGPDGKPRAGKVQLVDPAMPVASVGVWFRDAGADGRFSFPGVVPGAYSLSAQVSATRYSLTAGTTGANLVKGETTDIMTASADVPAAVDTRDVALRLQPGVTVSGTLALDGITAPFDRSRIRVTLAPLPSPATWEARPFETIPDVNGRFVFRDVSPGLYRPVIAGLPAGWLLASAVFNGRDAADHQLHVSPEGRYEGGTWTFTSRTSELSGTLSSVLGAPAAGEAIVLFPAQRELWLPASRRIHAVQTSPTGRYLIPGLPAGEYRLAVASDLETGQQFDPGFLDRLLPGSIAIVFSEGDRRTQDLRTR